MMDSKLKPLKTILFTLFLSFIASCSNLLGSDVTGIWLISGFGDAKMQLQQNNTQIVGIAYYQGQVQGQVYGQLSGANVTLQVRNTYSGIITYTGIVSSDGNSMQLRASDGKTLTMFKTG